MTTIEKTYWSVYLVVGCTIPICIIVASYFQIIKHIRKTKASLEAIGRSNKSKQQQLSQLISTLSLFSVSSIVCYGPPVFLKYCQLIPIDFGSADNCDMISMARNMVYLSPILNPLLYSMMGSRFRKTLKESLIFREST